MAHGRPLLRPPDAQPLTSGAATDERHPCRTRAGVIYDAVGCYAAAWWVGIAFNLAQLALVGGLLARMRRPVLA